MICDNAKKLGKMGGDKPPVYCLLACCFPVVGIFLLRQTAREQYGIEVNFKPLQNHFKFRFIVIIFIETMSHVNHFIQGDTMGDAVCSVCCAALVNCQTAAEIKARTGGGAPAAE